MPYTIVINGEHNEQDTFNSLNKANERFEQAVEHIDCKWATIVHRKRKDADVIAYWERA